MDTKGKVSSLLLRRFAMRKGRPGPDSPTSSHQTPPGIPLSRTSEMRHSLSIFLPKTLMLIARRPDSNKESSSSKEFSFVFSWDLSLLTISLELKNLLKTSDWPQRK